MSVHLKLVALGAVKCTCLIISPSTAFVFSTVSAVTLLAVLSTIMNSVAPSTSTMPLTTLDIEGETELSARLPEKLLYRTQYMIVPYSAFARSRYASLRGRSLSCKPPAMNESGPMTSNAIAFTRSALLRMSPPSGISAIAFSMPPFVRNMPATMKLTGDAVARMAVPATKQPTKAGGHRMCDSASAFIFLAV